MVSYQDMKMSEKRKAVIGAISLVVVVLGLSLASFFVFSKKIFRARVLGVSVEALTEEQAHQKLETELKLPEKIEIEVNTGQTVEIFNLNLAQIDAHIDYKKTVSEVYSYPRTGSLRDRAQKVLASVASPYEVSPAISFDEERLEEYLSVIAGQVYVQPNYPDINTQNGIILVNKGSLGRELDIEDLKQKIKNSLLNLSDEKVSIMTQITGKQLSDTEINEIKTHAEVIKHKTLRLVFERFSYELSPEQILELIYNINGTKEGPLTTLAAEIKPKIEREAKNPVFTEKDGRVSEFVPATQGIAIKQDDFEKNLITLVKTLNSDSAPQNFVIPTISTDPEITTEEVNNYGIKELIGYGESYYRGSIPERIHNVALAASKFNGVLIPPDAVFSFNDTVGDISGLTGFKQSYIIQGNQTVLGDGGGVCQVSTTLFRTALNAGLQIIERRPHAYRVSYYEQGSKPGIDATIYTPTVDLKIKNDTGNYILIQTKVENNNHLIFEFYGTKDGRVAQVTNPVISEIIPAPEDLYIDDPALPTGQVKQIDFKAAGAKVSFDYKVTKNGEVLFEKTFFSNYRPWQAKFLRGTGPASI